MEREKGEEGNAADHDHEQGHDEPRSAIRSLWRGLRDPHRVDESVRDELDKFHCALDGGATK